MKHYLFFASHSYAYSILRPLQDEIWRRGDKVAWWIEYSCPDMLTENETRLRSFKQVKQFAPIAVIAPGNWVYHFFPGIKVEVFHGYPMRKRIEEIDDHFTLRGWWDIYCTQGPSSTPYFEQLAQQNGYFKIYETGWCKADSFFTSSETETKRERPCILYAPTFSKGISSAWQMAKVIDKLASEEDWDWLITFHPLLLNDTQLLSDYQDLENKHPNVRFLRINEGIKTFRQTDVLLCDSSSLIVEYLMLGKPTVTYRNTHPGPFLLDTHELEEIGPAIKKALTYPEELMTAINEYTSYHEAHRDGQNSARVLDAIDDFIVNHKGKMKSKPFNLCRKIRMVKRYFRSIRK